MLRWIFCLVLLLLLAIGTGCRRNAPQKTDEEGHLIVEDVAKDSIVVQQQMIQEMKNFDQAVERWAAEEGIAPENQSIDLAKVAPRLEGRLADGKLIDPVGNPYVILKLDPGSSVRITVSSATASRPEFKDLNWGEYAPR
jgi:hypothetical protein